MIEKKGQKEKTKSKKNKRKKVNNKKEILNNKKLIIELFVLIIAIIGTIGGNIYLSHFYKNVIVEKGGKETINMNIGDMLNLSDYIDNIDMVESYTIDKDDIVSVDEQYNIKVLQEGDAKITVNYNNNRTEEFNFQCRVKESKSAVKGDIFKINLNQNGGTGGWNNIYFKYQGGFYYDQTCQMYMNDSYNPVAIPKKSGYTFGGYYRNQNGNGTKVITERGYVNTAYFSNTMFSSDSTIYAKWISNGKSNSSVFPIYLNKANGSGGDYYIYEKYGIGFYKDHDCSQKMNYYQNNVSIPTREGYKFNGYYTGKNGTGKKIIDANGYFTNTIESSYYTNRDNIYASWTAISLVYTINLNKGNGIGGDNYVYESYGVGVCKDSSCSTMMYINSNPISIPTKSEYTFGGYYTGVNGTGKQLINENGYITNNFKNKRFKKNTIIYAKWNATQNKVYNITLNKQNGSGGTNTIYEKYGIGIYKNSSCTRQMTTSNNRINIPRRSGYTFMGYYSATDGNGIQLINENGYITNYFNNSKYNTSTTIYAHWKIKDVSYRNPINDYRCYNGHKYYITACQVQNSTKKIKCKYTKKDGVSKNGTIKKHLLLPESSCQATNTEIYTITLDGQNATNQGTTEIYERYNTGIYLDSSATNKKMATVISKNKITVPRRTNYIFKGYYQYPGGRGKQLISITGAITPKFTPTIFNKNGKLYAYWEADYSDAIYDNRCYNKHIYHITTCQVQDSTKKAKCKYDKKDNTAESGTIKEYLLQPASSCQATNTEIYTITLDGQNATSQGTAAIYERYNTGIYLDSAATNKKMATLISENKITVPRRTNYIFKGYYQYPGGGGQQLISITGAITPQFTPTIFNGNGKLYAYWEADYVEKVDKNQCYVNGNTKTLYHITYCQKQDTDKTARCKYDKKDGVSASATINRYYLKPESYCKNTSKSGQIYEITLNNEKANITGTTKIYEKYEYGIYLENPPKNKMKTSLNPIIVPKKNNYNFNGYYTGTNGQGKKLINENGNITSTFTSTLFSADATLHADWKKENNNPSSAISPTTIKYKKASTGKYIFINNPECLTNKDLADTDKGKRIIYKSNFSGNMELYYEHGTCDNDITLKYGIKFYNPNNNSVTLTLNKQGASFNGRWQETWERYYNSSSQKYTIKPKEELLLYQSCNDSTSYCNFTTYKNYAYVFKGKWKEFDGVMNVTSSGNLNVSTFAFDNYSNTYYASYPGNSTRNTNGHDGGLRVYSGEVNNLPEIYNDATFTINDSISANQKLKVKYDGSKSYNSWITNINKTKLFENKPDYDNVYFKDMFSFKFKDDQGRNIVTNPLPSRDSRISDPTYSHFNLGNWGVHYHENITIKNTGSRERTVSFIFNTPVGDYSEATYGIVEDTKNIKGVNNTDFKIRNKKTFLRYKRRYLPEKIVVWKIKIPANKSVTVPYILTLGGMSNGMMEKYIYVDE